MYFVLVQAYIDGKILVSSDSSLLFWPRFLWLSICLTAYSTIEVALLRTFSGLILFYDVMSCALSETIYFLSQV